MSYSLYADLGLWRLELCGCAGQDLEVVPEAILFIIVNKSMNKRISAMSFALSRFLLC